LEQAKTSAGDNRLKAWVFYAVTGILVLLPVFWDLGCYADTLGWAKGYTDGMHYQPAASPDEVAYGQFVALAPVGVALVYITLSTSLVVLAYRGVWPSEDGKRGLAWGLAGALFILFWLLQIAFGVLWLGTWPSH
jgi:hypothetical protein